MSVAIEERFPGSQQVSWLTVHEFVRAVLNQMNSYPMAGTPAWCSLAHDNPLKWAAVLDAGQHHALRMELAQEARAEAARDIAADDNWTAIARSVAVGRGDAFIRRQSVAR